MSYIRLRKGAFIRYLERKCEFERRQDHVTEWRAADGSYEHFTFTDSEIQEYIARGEMTLFNGHGRPPPEPAQHSKIYGARGPTAADIEEGERKLEYVLKIHTLNCLRPDSKPADWQAAIDALWNEKGCKWTRLRGGRRGQAVDKPSLKSVRRWTAEAGPRPTLERLISRHRHKGNYQDRIEAKVREIIDGCVRTHWMSRPPIDIETFRDIVNGRIAELNADLNELQSAYREVGFTALRTSISAVPLDEVMRARHDEMAVFLKFGSAEAQPDPKAPLDRVELDSTPADLLVLCSKTGLPLGRATIVICIDRCTRMVLGWFVTFEKPSILALMQCLRNSMLKKIYIKEMNEEHDWNIRHECVTFGIPVSLDIDRALENVATHVAHLARKAGINQIHIKRRKSPWLKGCVERTIRTMSERLLHPTKGTTFHNALVKMGYNPEKDAVCTVDDLDWGLHKYFIDIYPRELRRSLGNRRAIDVWNELTRKYPLDSVAALEDIDHLFGRTDFAVPGRFGVNANSLQYFSRELLEVQRSASFQAALARQGGKVEYGCDPADIGRIYVKLPHVERTIIVPVASKWREYATGLSLFAQRCIRDYARGTSRNANRADQLLKCKLELLEIMRGSALRRRGGIASRQLLARFEGVNRVARSGDDAATTVVGSPAHDFAPRPQRLPRRHINDGDPKEATTAGLEKDLPPSSASVVEHGSPRLTTSTKTIVATAPSSPLRAKKGYRP